MSTITLAVDQVTMCDKKREEIVVYQFQEVSELWMS